MAPPNDINQSDGHELARAQFETTAVNYAASVPHATSDSLAIVRKWTAGSRYDSALDIATGPGFTAFAIAPYCNSVFASDISPAMLKQVDTGAAERQLTNIDTAIADATNLRFEDARFQLITCRTAPHHFNDISRFVGEVYRTLSPGGKFILVDTTTAEDEEPRAWHHHVESLRDPSHVKALTASEWVAALRSGGFQVADSTLTRVDMTFRLWVARSRTPAGVVAELESAFATASDAAKACFKIARIRDGKDFRFSWPVFSANTRKPV